MGIKITGILLLYAALFLIMQGFSSSKFNKDETKTFVITGILWAVSVFIGNYICYLIGIMSFIPWVNNFLHTFIWIGFCLTYLYITTRMRFPIWRQVLYFSIFSFIVKYAEQMLFGIWEHDHFMWIFEGNFAYILGWSLMDGLYPFITNLGLKMLSKFVRGIVI